MRSFITNFFITLFWRKIVRAFCWIVIPIFICIALFTAVQRRKDDHFQFGWFQWNELEADYPEAVAEHELRSEVSTNKALTTMRREDEKPLVCGKQTKSTNPALLAFVAVTIPYSIDR